MPFKPLVTAGIESLLNTFLYRSPALKTARSRLLGKVLRVEVKGFSTSLILVFSERQVDVLGEWAGDADCTVIAYASVLPKLRDRQQLTALIRSGELEVQGVQPAALRRSALHAEQPFLSGGAGNAQDRL